MRALFLAAFVTAREAALAADPGMKKDGGASNRDTPVFRLERVSQYVVLAAAADAQVRVTAFTWFGKRWFRLHGFLNGRGFRRTAMATAAAQALKRSGIDGLETAVEYRMD